MAEGHIRMQKCLCPNKFVPALSAFVHGETDSKIADIQMMPLNNPVRTFRTEPEA